MRVPTFIRLSQRSSDCLSKMLKSLAYILDLLHVCSHLATRLETCATIILVLTRICVSACPLKSFHQRRLHAMLASQISLAGLQSSNLTRDCYLLSHSPRAKYAPAAAAPSKTISRRAYSTKGLVFNGSPELASSGPLLPFSGFLLSFSCFPVVLSCRGQMWSVLHYPGLLAALTAHRLNHEYRGVVHLRSSIYIALPCRCAVGNHSTGQRQTQDDAVCRYCEEHPRTGQPFSAFTFV